MSRNLITPHASRITCTTVNVNPFVGAMAGKSFPAPTFCASSYGDAIFIYWNSTNNSLAILRVKYDGTYCWYINKAPSQISLSVHYNIAIQVDDSTFIISNTVDGAILKVTVPGFFVPSGVVQFSTSNFAYPPAPCGAATTNTLFWYASNGHVLIEYVQGFPLAYNLWAMTAQVGTQGVTPINAGMCGNFPNAVNPLVYNSLNFRGVVNPGWQDLLYSTDNLGNQISRDVEYNDLLGHFVSVGSSNLTDGTLYCGAIGAFPLYTMEEAYVYDTQNSVFNGYRFKSNYASLYAGGADFPCSAITNNYSCLEVFNGPYFVEFTSAMTYTFNGVYLSKRNVWIGVQQSTLIGVNTPTAAPPDGLFNPPPIINSPQVSSLLNWHRPISTTGKFKT